MSPLPVRLEAKARRVPSGEYMGRVSLAGWDTRRCASPPARGADQMSPPLTKAISARLGATEGSVKYGADCWASAEVRDRAAASKDSLCIGFAFRIHRLPNAQRPGWS